MQQLQGDLRLPSGCARTLEPKRGTQLVLVLAAVFLAPNRRFGFLKVLGLVFLEKDRKFWPGCIVRIRTFENSRESMQNTAHVCSGSVLLFGYRREAHEAIALDVEMVDWGVESQAGRLERILRRKTQCQREIPPRRKETQLGP